MHAPGEQTSSFTTPRASLPKEQTDRVWLVNRLTITFNLSGFSDS